MITTVSNIVWKKIATNRYSPYHLALREIFDPPFSLLRISQNICSRPIFACYLIHLIVIITSALLNLSQARVFSYITFIPVVPFIPMESTLIYQIPLWSSRTYKNLNSIRNISHFFYRNMNASNTCCNAFITWLVNNRRENSLYVFERSGFHYVGIQVSLMVKNYLSRDDSFMLKYVVTVTPKYHLYIMCTVTYFRFIQTSWATNR